MKQWTKHRIALILALAMVMALLAGCVGDEPPATTDGGLENVDPVVTETTEPTVPETTEPQDAMGWLEENLNSIFDSLLGSDYASVIDLLLGKKDELADNANYNALLYIAYMGEKNEAAAAALLKNPNLNTDAFTDAFLSSVGKLEGNPDIAEIQRRLMEHMLALSESNPEAYGAVAKIGVNIKNTNPNDPTAYAARYIAALAMGNEEAAKAILEEAKANGISPEDLKSTAIKYREEYNLTSITVEEIEKGKKTETTYNQEGEVVKSEVTVDNKDGTETLKITNSDGKLLVEVLRNKKTKVLIKRTDYMINQEQDAATGKITEVLTGEREIYVYEKGVLTALGAYDKDGKLMAYVSLDAKGKPVSGYEYVNGEKFEYPKEILDAYSFVVKAETGELVSRTKPKAGEDGKMTGKTETVFDYVHPAGLPTTITQYDYSAEQGFTKKRTIAITWNFNGDVKGQELKTVSTYYSKNAKETESIFEYDKNGKIEKATKLTYSVSNSILLMESIFEYQNEEIVKAHSTNYDSKTGEKTSYTIKDYVNHTTQMYDYEENKYREGVLDETNKLVLSQAIYRGLDDKKVLLETETFYYEGTTKTGSYRLMYDAAERVTQEYTYGDINADGKVEDEDLILLVTYTYDENGTLMKKVIDDFINDTQQFYNYEDNVLAEFELDETRTYTLVTKIYNGTGEDKVLTEKWFYYYDGGKRAASEKEVYDASERLIQKVTFGSPEAPGKIDPDKKSKSVTYQYDEAGKMTRKTAYDFITHIEEAYDYTNNVLVETQLDEGHKYKVIVITYNGISTDTGVEKKEFFYYEGTNWVGGLLVAYDAAGNVSQENYYEHVGADGLINLDVPSQVNQYTYNGANQVHVKTEKTYDEMGNLTSKIVTEHFYDANNNLIERVENGLDVYGSYTMIYKDYYDEKQNLVKSELYMDMGESGLMLLATAESKYDEKNQQIEYIYQDSQGNVLQHSTYTYGAGTKTATTTEGGVTFTEVTKYTYDDAGVMVSYTVTTTYADGTTKVEYFTAEGYRYQPAI